MLIRNGVASQSMRYPAPCPHVTTAVAVLLTSPTAAATAKAVGEINNNAAAAASSYVIGVMARRGRVPVRRAKLSGIVRLFFKQATTQKNQCSKLYEFLRMFWV